MNKGDNPWTRGYETGYAEASAATKEALTEALYSFHSWAVEAVRGGVHPVAQQLDKAGLSIVSTEELEGLRKAVTAVEMYATARLGENDPDIGWRSIKAMCRAAPEGAKP